MKKAIKARDSYYQVLDKVHKNNELKKQQQQQQQQEMHNNNEVSNESGKF